MEANKCNFLNSKLNLPLFMVSRINLKRTQKKGKLNSYLGKNINHYTHGCTDEEAHEKKLQCQRNADADAMKKSNRCKVSTKSVERNASHEKPWQLSPNLYDTIKRPYEEKAGLGGAYWRKMLTTEPRVVNKSKGIFKLYDLPRDTERMDTKCHKQKSIFLSNARERKATARCMISSPLTCYKDPKFPAPNTYFGDKPIKKLEIPEPLNPHIYYRNSVVPLKKNSIHPAHISFSPAPGRYEIRYRNICPCRPNLINYPDLQLHLERAKRLKFRHLPYEKIKARLYCSPDWRHVRGDGHRHVFKGAKPYKSSITAAVMAKKQKVLIRYADLKYLLMINNTPSCLGSIRQEPMPRLPTRIAYNSMIKVVKRKQLRFNKKNAFGSSVDRWKDAERPLILTISQLEKLKQQLPLERQLRDHPIMTKDKTEISTKLTVVPPHMMPSYVPTLRKRLYKFLPLPEAKVLVTDSDTRPVIEPNNGFYCRVLDAQKFFKGEAKE